MTGVGRKSMKLIKTEVAERSGLSVADLEGSNRARRLVRPRQEAMAEMRAAGWSYPQIGLTLNRDHTTVIHGVRSHGVREAKRLQDAYAASRREWRAANPNRERADAQ